MAKVNKAREKAIEAYRNRMKRSKSKSEESDFTNTSIFKSGLDVKFWNVPEKKNYFDIIPYTAGGNDPDCEGGEQTYVFQPFMHRNVGPEKWDIVCLRKTYKKSCPICEEVTSKLDEGTDWNDIDFKVQKNPRAIYNVIVRNDSKTEKEGVQILHTTSLYMEQPLQDLAEGKGVDKDGNIEIETIYFDEEEGKTISFKRKGKQRDTEFSAHKFEDRDYTITKEEMEQAHCLDELVIIPTYDEAKAKLLGEELEAEEDGPKKGTKKSRVRGKEDSEEEDRDLKKGKAKTKVREEEPEEELEESLREELGEMDKKGLRKYINDNDIDVMIKKGMNEEDIIDAIIKEVEGEGGEEEGEKTGGENECPGGGTFGEDWDSLKGCDNCPEDPTWNACMKLNDEMTKDDD